MNVNLWAACLGFLVVVSCKSKDEAKPVAEAILKDADGKAVGKVELGSFGEVITQIDIDISTTSTHAAPGKHAVHIHEGTKCEGPDFKSAGDHFNPNHERHGDPKAEEHHAGDLGNVDLDTNRKGSSRIESAMLSVAPNHTESVIGHAVIMHEKADDFMTQTPPGNAGGRIACGLITQKL